MPEALDTTRIIHLNGMVPFYLGGVQHLYDFSGNSNHPAPLNFAGDDSEYVDVSNKQGIYTDNVNEQLSLGLDPQFDFVMESFTIEAWINPSASGLSRPIFGKYLANTDGYLFHLSAADRIEFITYQGGASQTTNSTVVGASDLNRHQFVAVRNGASVQLFKDGIEVTYNAVGVHVNPVSPSARNGLAFGFVGYSSDFSIWTRAHGSEEIHNRYLSIMGGRV